MPMVTIPAVVGFVGLLFVVYLSTKVLAKENGNATMQQLSGYIYEGAMAFLAREYRAIGIFAVLVAIFLAVGIGWATAVAYIVGAICSLSAGLTGMHIATRANVRTAQAATKGFNEAIGVAFPGGAVMGMSVVSIGLFALSILYWLFGGGAMPGAPLLQAVSILAGFSMGASSVALFARVGGGIYTKAADVGADLVGKVEAGIPEDDPRNPAVIADLVGDNVGDVAGMGADLFESYVGAIVSGMIIAAATLPGAVGGAYLTRGLSSSVFSLLFGLVMIAVAGLLFFGRTVSPSRRAPVRRLVDASGAAHVYRVDAWKGVLVSALVGFMSSVLGVGGGIVHVPFLVVTLSLPVHVATATSLFVLSISSFAGAATFLALGDVAVPTVALMGAGVLAGAQLGARLSRQTGAALIRRILAVSLTLVGVRMLLPWLARAY